MTIALRTRRLLLRQWREEDAEPFASLSADPLAMRFLLRPADRSALDAAVVMIRGHWTTHGFGNWVVELPGEAQFVGIVGLNHVRWTLPFTPAVEAAWRLSPAFWGKGYASEAARAAIEDGFFRLGLTEIIAYTVPANRASWQVMERLGMTRDPSEDFDHPAPPKGHPLRRHILYRLRRPSS